LLQATKQQQRVPYVLRLLAMMEIIAACAEVSAFTELCIGVNGTEFRIARVRRPLTWFEMREACGTDDII
jgi:hypothetical protein